MSMKPKLIDTATGASPPRPSTRDMACSPICFESLIESTSSDDFTHRSIPSNQETQTIQNNIPPKKSDNNKQSSSLLLPLSNTTSFLPSMSTVEPMSLMSIGVNNGYSFGSTRLFSSTVNNTDNNRRWSIDPPSRHNFKYRQRIKRNNRYNQTQSCQGYDTISSTTRINNWCYNNYRTRNVCRRCCTCHCHYLL